MKRIILALVLLVTVGPLVAFADDFEDWGSYEAWCGANGVTPVYEDFENPKCIPLENEEDELEKLLKEAFSEPTDDLSQYMFNQFMLQEIEDAEENDL